MAFKLHIKLSVRTIFSFFFPFFSFSCKLILYWWTCFLYYLEHACLSDADCNTPQGNCNLTSYTCSCSPWFTGSYCELGIPIYPSILTFYHISLEKRKRSYFIILTYWIFFLYILEKTLLLLWIIEKTAFDDFTPREGHASAYDSINDVCLNVCFLQY